MRFIKIAMVRYNRAWSEVDSKKYKVWQLLNLKEVPDVLIAFCIWSLSSLLFVVFGICTLLAKKPMVFWAHERKIEVSNVKAYNKALAILYFVYSLVILILGIPMLLSSQNSAGFIIPVLGLPIASILMIAVYVTCIEAKYRK